MTKIISQNDPEKLPIIFVDHLYQNGGLCLRLSSEQLLRLQKGRGTMAQVEYAGVVPSER